jgi:hypothetical protein
VKVVPEAALARLRKVLAVVVPRPAPPESSSKTPKPARKPARKPRAATG